MTMPIRARLTVWYSAILAAILVALGLFVTLRVNADLMRRTDQALALTADELSTDFSTTGGENEFRDVADASLAGLPRDRSFAQLLSPAGAVEDWSGVGVARTIALSPNQLSAAGRGERRPGRISRSGQTYRTLAVRFPNDSAGQVLVVGTSLAEVNESTWRLIVWLLAACPLGLALAAVGGWWLAGASLRPVEQMTREAAEIEASRLSRRVPVPAAKDEIHRLAATLNSMLERLEASSEAQRRFVADASHELRTPLTAMRAEIDVSLRSRDLTDDAREALTSAADQVGGMTRTVEGLLTLASLDAGKLALFPETLDLRALAEGVAASLSILADEQGVRVRVEGPAAWVMADHDRMLQVLTNLLDNGIKYAGRNGTVRIETWMNGVEAGVVISDSGPGIPPGSLPHVFDRFYRSDPARSTGQGGSGLGLAIAKDIVAAHGGRIWAEGDTDGGSNLHVALRSVARSR
ncbi:MAG: HAMP domain-containing protein [Actinobacteria bacterium]|nr:MAG: HAMP domain-containing protein [Actinomycetota bacterium]